MPIGKAVIRREGTDVSILAYGTMVHVAEAAANDFGIDAEIIDLQIAGAARYRNHSFDRSPRPAAA